MHRTNAGGKSHITVFVNGNPCVVYDACSLIQQPYSLPFNKFQWAKVLHQGLEKRQKWPIMLREILRLYFKNPY